MKEYRNSHTTLHCHIRKHPNRESVVKYATPALDTPDVGKLSHSAKMSDKIWLAVAERVQPCHVNPWQVICSTLRELRDRRLTKGLFSFILLI